MNAPFTQAETYAAALAKPRTVLLLAYEFVAQYRVLRCAAMAGAKVHVMGPPQTRALAFSRFCAAYHPYSFGRQSHRRQKDQPDPAAMAADIDALCRANRIDMVLASDVVTTRLLGTIAPFLKTPSFPVPEPSTFDALATKNAFMAFCRERGLPQPEGQIFDTVEALEQALENGKVRYPAIFKPVDRAGSIGVERVDRHNVIHAVARIDYAPILVQDFIEGEDRCITIMALNGKVTKEVVYWHPGGIFRFGEEPALSKIVTDLAHELNLSGVYNFDARVDAEGRVWMIECNPRFFFNMDVVAVAGMNFAALDDNIPGVPVTLAHDDMRVPLATARDLLRGHLPDANDRRMLKHWLKDPLVFVLVSLAYSRRWRFEPAERLAARLRRP
jgi:biotin carboxylase